MADSYEASYNGLVGDHNMSWSQEFKNKNRYILEIYMSIFTIFNFLLFNLYFLKTQNKFCYHV